MTTMLDRAIEAGCEGGRYVVESVGVTGGSWIGCNPGKMIDDPVAIGYERNNLSLYIRHHPNAKRENCQVGSRARWCLEGARVVFGAKYGGGPGTCAIQRWYAVLVPKN